FKKIYIEISNICNLQCSFCPVVERDKKIMSVEHFTHVLNQAMPLTEEVCLHLMGEPLAHPQFEKIVAMIPSSTPLFLTTNGTLIQRHAATLLASSSNIKQINFSLHALADRPHCLQPIFEFSKAMLDVRPEVYMNFRLWNLQGRTEHHPFTREVMQ